MTFTTHVLPEVYRLAIIYVNGKKGRLEYSTISLIVRFGHPVYLWKNLLYMFRYLFKVASW